MRSKGMVERTVSLGVMSGSETPAVRETLHAQQELLQKLHQELDVEREASSTAASEALSMILRLQGEKAALEMEASQYKRMAEEKMCHAETSLAFFEDLIYQKEMEIASLEFQVQAYRCRLLSLGCTDPAVTDNKFPENLVFLGEESTGDHKNNHNRPRSLSPNPLNDGPDLLLADKQVINESFDDKKSPENSSPPGDLNSFWEQIKRIDERVRELSDSRDSQKENRYSSLRRESISRQLISQVSNTILESTKSDINSIIENMKNVERCSLKYGHDSPSSSSNVQDIFEVPQTIGKLKIREEEQREKESSREETDSLKKVCQKMHNLQRKLSKPPIDMRIKIEGRPRDDAGTTEFQAEWQQIRERIERLDGNTRDDRREELGLLKEIQEQLNLMQSEIRSLRSTVEPRRPESPRQDHLSLHSVKEVNVVSSLFPRDLVF